MSGLKRLLASEPTSLVSLIRQGLTLLVLLGLDLTNYQIAAILGFLEGLLWFINRQLVTPVAKVEAKVDAAVEEALTDEAEPMTDDQRQLVTDLREIITTLKAHEKGGV